MLMAVVVLSVLFENHIYAVSSLFIGFIGMIAISATFLSGIFGSTLLLIFGAYIPCLIFFGCGVLTGAIAVVKAIKVCLEKFRTQTIYVILGMQMIKERSKRNGN